MNSTIVKMKEEDDGYTQISKNHEYGEENL